MTFSIAVAAIWVVVSVFAHTQRARLVEKLVIVVATGTEKEAVAALRQMVEMPDPPLATFALAATSPSRSIARQAQESISELVHKWQAQARAPQNAARVAARLESLAAALHAERDSISELDHPWLARTTEKMLRLAGAASPENSLDLAICCEALLAVAAAHPPERIRIFPIASATIDAAPDAIFTPPSRVALESLVPQAELNPEPQTSHPPRPFEVERDAARKVATPIPVEESVAPGAPDLDPWAKIDSRSLLERWVASAGTAQQQIERELKRRGFGQLRSDVVRLGLSGETAARVALVQDLPAIPGVGAKSWLMLLAEDADADVRLAAVTMMTISKDRELLEKAWHVAVHDRDPRIAGLAEKLRNRR